MLNSRLPSFKFLIGFEAAARLGNYSRAADELCISQSAISHQIAQLEQQLGQPLFRRKGRGVELTVAGRLLLDSVGKSLEQLRNGLHRMETYMDDRLATVVCPAHIATGWLQPRVDRLLEAHPGLCPIISIDETARYIDELDVDIVITREPLKQQGLYEVPLLTDELVAVCTPGQAGNPDLGMVGLEGDLTDDRISPFIRQHFGGRRKMAMYDDPRLVLDATLRGHGMALVSRLLADDALRTGQLLPLPGYPSLPNGTVWIARVEGETRMPLIRETFDSLLHFARSDTQIMSGIDQSS